MEWDVFISHASDDKNNFVAPLANTLTEFKLNVWYDEFTLKIGDSLSGSIDKGLANSRYGIVVISRDFIRKNWTEYELRGLISREIGNDKVILPIWHNITRTEILKFSPTLADKFALNTSNYSIRDIAFQILEVVNPSTYQNLVRVIMEERLRDSATIIQADISKVNLNREPRHEFLPTNLIARINIIQKALFEVLPYSLEETILNFMRDKNPDREIVIWEGITSSFLSFFHRKDLSIEYKKEVFNILLNLSLQTDEKKIRKKLNKLTYTEYNELKSLYRSFCPEMNTGILLFPATK